MITEVRYRVRTNIPSRTKQNRQLGTDKQELEDQSLERDGREEIQGETPKTKHI